MQSCGPPPTQLAADRAPTMGLPQWSATTVQPQAALPLRCLSSHKQGLGHDQGRRCPPAAGGRAGPSRRGGRAWGPENTFMWQRQGAGVSVSHPGCPPKWQQWGQPLAGLSADPTSDRLALTGPSQAPSASVGGCWGLGGLRQLGQFVQCSSESRLRRRAAWPLPDTCHSNHHRELFTPGPVGRASGEGLAVPTASTQLPVTPVTTFWGQQQG